VRAVVSRPAPPAAVSALTLDDVQAAIRGSWSAETSDDPEEWSPENPARGQCGVTALAVRDLLGGEILVANVLRDGRRVERHAWNRLASGLTIDLTRAQFAPGYELDGPRVEEPLTASRSPERVQLFASRVRARLGSQAGS
jgi:hypothetical protein